MAGKVGWLVVVAAAIGSAWGAEPAATFQSIGSLSESTAQVSITATPSGRVVIGEAWLADVFDAQANAWLPHIMYHGSHWTAGAALVPDGRVLEADGRVVEAHEHVHEHEHHHGHDHA